MARTTHPPLDTDDRFPRFKVTTLDRGPMELPGDLGDRWAVVLAYRGHW